MPRYRSTGQLDDPVLEDGDGGFVGINNRLEDHQLQAGEVWQSQNGRIDGSWRPRKAIDAVSGALTQSQNSLKLPFLIFSPALVMTALQRSTSKLFVGGGTTTAPDGTRTGWVRINGVGFTTYDPNGFQRVSVIITFGTFQILWNDENAPVSSETYTVGSSEVEVVLDDSIIESVYGSCLFSDPQSLNAESVMVATNANVQKIALSDYSKTVISYPSGVTVSDKVEMIQAFDKVLIFREGEAHLEYYRLPIHSASQSGTTVTLDVIGNSLTSGDVVTISGLDFATNDPNGEYEVTVSGDTVTYTVISSNTETFGVNSDSWVDPGRFVTAPSGDFTQPSTFEIDADDVDITDGLLTATVTGNTTIFKGDAINVLDTNDEHLTELVGRSFTVLEGAEEGSTSIQWYCDMGDHDGSGHTSKTFQFSKPISLGLGYMHQPAAPWGVYHQRRLWTPFFYEQKGTSPVITTDRGIRDEIAASDILDSNTFDRLENQFRITGGIADYLEAIHPFYEDQLLVFNRNSIHLISGISGSLADTSTNELTREIGCLARKSVVTQGNNIFFLSDSGVYRLQFLDEYNLRGVERSLSEKIDPIIKRLNASLAAKAVGVYFDNRYWLAVPLDSTEGANDAAGNNTILVYSLLNEAWESVDVIGDSRFSIANFYVGRSEERNDLYCVTENGGVHKLNAISRNYDVLSLSFGESFEQIPISSILETRGYNFSMQDRKRFTRLQILAQTEDAQADADVSFTTKDPDQTVTLSSFHDELGEYITPNDSASLRPRIGGVRGQSGRAKITPTIGRPKIVSVSVQATSTNRSSTPQR